MYGEEYLQNSLSSLNTNNRDEVIAHNNGPVETDIEQSSKGKFFNYNVENTSFIKTYVTVFLIRRNKSSDRISKYNQFLVFVST